MNVYFYLLCKMSNEHSLLQLLNPVTRSNNDVVLSRPFEHSAYKKFHKHDINKVDDKHRKILLKNRKTAETFRMKKKMIEDFLRYENKTLKEQIKKMKQLLIKHGIPY